MSIINYDYTEDTLNKLEPVTKLQISTQMIKNTESSISQRADGLIIICELYQKLTNNQYDFSKTKITNMQKEIRNVIQWMLYNEKNCVVHHELFYQIAARNMIELIPDMAYCAEHSKSIVSRHEALENIGMMKAWKYLTIIKNALNDPNPDIAQTAQWAMDRYARYKDEPGWSALDIV